MQAFGAATKAAYERDPGGDPARQTKVTAIVARYDGLKNEMRGPMFIDSLCKEYDEPLAVYE
jgi:hypothetical protein